LVVLFIVVPIALVVFLVLVVEFVLVTRHEFARFARLAFRFVLFLVVVLVARQRPTRLPDLVFRFVFLFFFLVELVVFRRYGLTCLFGFLFWFIGIVEFRLLIVVRVRELERFHHLGRFLLIVFH